MSNRIISTFIMGALLLAATLAFAGAKSAVVTIPAGDQDVIVLAKSGDKDGGAFLGIVPEEVTSDIAADYGVAAGQGVLIESTVDGSPADEAGLRANDILLAIGGQKLTGPSELRVQLDKFKEGDEVSLTYRRGGNERTATVKLAPREHSWSWSWGGEEGEAPGAPPMPPKWEGKFGFKSDVAFAGIVTQELSDGLKSYFKVAGGALISEVVEKSPAEKAGLKAGDVITKIGSDDVEDEGDVSRVIRDMDPDQTVDFHIIREGKSMVIPVTLTNRKDFYGDAGDADYEFGYSFDKADAEQMALEMEELQKELKGMGVELDMIPEVNMDLQIHPDGPRIFIGDGDARAISRDEGWWNWSFQDLRSKVKTGIEELKKDMESLKQELQQLRSEIKERMSFFWGPAIDITPKA